MLARKEEGALSPFLLLALPGIRGEEQRACADLWMARKLAISSRERASRAYRFRRGGSGKIRIGYLSNDFHDHATALLLVEVIERHDRTRFEIVAYSYGKDDGRGMRQRLERAFDRFVDIRHESIAESSDAINRDGVDILVDLKGFTRHTRTEILSFRPAPIQVNYLGFPGTLGGSLCDYIVTDRFLTPPSVASEFSEAFAYMPDTYQPHGRQTPPGPPPTRSQVGLPEEGFVFCCFNQSHKVTPAIFDRWCSLLSHCPGSVLWLLHDRTAIGNLRNAAMMRGVVPQRLIFAEHVSQQEHLARLQLADLALDTLPYNSHTTASDALWAGVPLVTCPGETFASRVAGSLLQAVGLPELITEDLTEYFSLAYCLATEPTRLAQVKAKLLDNRLTTALFDVERYTRHLERLYEQMWAAHVAGIPPRAISCEPFALGSEAPAASGGLYEPQ